MPIFENKGVKYDVSPEYIPDFASEYPDAVIVIERPDKPYRCLLYTSDAADEL